MGEEDEKGESLDMGLFSFCNNDGCWQRKQCYRWAQYAKPGDVEKAKP